METEKKPFQSAPPEEPPPSQVDLPVRVTPWQILLFVTTVLSTTFVGAQHQGVDPFQNPWHLLKGLPFSISLMVILTSHEMGHYITSRRHRVRASLPYFIPAPTLFGTLGAFIKMFPPIANRTALLRIGMAGPLVGFVFSVAAAWLGLMWSTLIPLDQARDALPLGSSLIFQAIVWLTLGEIPEGYDVLLHPVAFAGWIGFLVTALNLMPIGQLDGGHIAYAVSPSLHRSVSMGAIPVLLVLGVFLWPGWLLWAGLAAILGVGHPPVQDPRRPLQPQDQRLAAAALGLFVLCFVPVPVPLGP